MTKKDYEAMAEIIKNHQKAVRKVYDNQDAYCRVALVAVNNLVIDLAQYFKKDNFNFDFDKFYKACDLN